MKYYVISYNEDGDVPSVDVLTKQELESRLNDQYWGDKPMMINLEKSIENQSGLLIIKGQQIAPKAARVVEAWEVD